jgi:hypothetical protein
MESLGCRRAIWTAPRPRWFSRAKSKRIFWTNGFFGFYLMVYKVKAGCRFSVPPVGATRFGMLLLVPHGVIVGFAGAG